MRSLVVVHSVGPHLQGPSENFLHMSMELIKENLGVSSPIITQSFRLFPSLHTSALDVAKADKLGLLLVILF